MNDTMRLEGREVKREILILNVVCVVLALCFLAFAIYNALAAESIASFLTIDNLFTTAFCLLMALIFISIPAGWAVETGTVKVPFVSKMLAERNAGATTAALPGARSSAAAIGPGNRAAGGAALPAPAPVQKDAKGRPIPPDVQKMLTEMNRSEQKSEQQTS